VKTVLFDNSFVTIYFN